MLGHLKQRRKQATQKRYSNGPCQCTAQETACLSTFLELSMHVFSAHERFLEVAGFEVAYVQI
jgi:hypothetical protein